MFHYFSFLPLIICFEYCSYNQCNLFIFMFYIIIIQYQNTFRQNILIKNSIVPILYLNLKFKKAIFFLSFHHSFILFFILPISLFSSSLSIREENTSNILPISQKIHSRDKTSTSLPSPY